MEIQVLQQQGRVPVTVLHVKGEINATSFDQLQTQAQALIKKGTRYLVLDLAEVPYITSYGIRAISQVYTWLREAAGVQPREVGGQPHLALANASPQVRKVAEAAGLSIYVPLHETLQEAITSF